MVIIKTLIFIILVPGTVTVGIPYLLLSSGWWRDSYESGGFRLVGILPIALGAITYFRCAWDFAFDGNGTPAPLDPPRMLVSRGLYRMVRNPMYLGVGFVLVGEAIVFQSVALFVYALVVWLWLHVLVLWYEEPTLRRSFGRSYDEYCQTVPRWIPRLGLSSGAGPSAAGRPSARASRTPGRPCA
jgi:protein-S-isoprenylcysteine O-methyltransferase Ste14